MRDDKKYIGDILRKRGIKRRPDIKEVWSGHDIPSTKTRHRKRRLTKTFKNKFGKYGVGTKYSNMYRAMKLASAKYARKRLIVVSATLVLVFLVINNITNDQYLSGITDKLGVSTDSYNKNSEQDHISSSDSSVISVVQHTDFPLLFPGGEDSANFDIAKVSPPGQPAVYAYLDNLKGATLRISQQELPQDFIDNLESKVKEIAEDFNALSVIELNGSKIYHGYSGEAGGVQSLVFAKNRNLVLIASSLKLSDDTWSVYVDSIN